ncbi:PepSY-associated TM helix domain-containing protein [Arenimonas aestuarii]
MRNVLFQVHWFLGITAGLVLVLVGVTGAMLSYEDAVLRAINPGVLVVPANGRPRLAPGDLLERVQQAMPGRTLQAVSLSTEADVPARVTFAPSAEAVPGPGGRMRGESRGVDPYTGALLPQPRGEGFFRTTMQLHRWLATGAVGKQIVGASTVALVFFCLSGLYLRWPRRWKSPRAWLLFDPALTGRRFLWHLHSVVATWLLVPYLVMALTGLYWSYGWYRDGLYALSGAEAPQRGGDVADPGDASTPLDVQAAFAVFQAQVGDWTTVSLRLPDRPGASFEFSYRSGDAAHERANNRLVLDAATATVQAHERFADKPAAQRFMAGIFPLHSGAWFGPVGLAVFCLASLAMPLFAVTGLQLYLDRRAKKRAGRQRRRERALAAARRSAG